MSTIRCVFIGGLAVGKTKLLKTASFDSGRCPPTIGVDNVLFDYRNYHFQCWDTSGSPKFKAVSQLFIKSAAVIVYVYDAHRPETLVEVPQNAIIVANVKNGRVEHHLNHLHINVADRDDVESLLDILIESFVSRVSLGTIEIESTRSAKDCCVCC